MYDPDKIAALSDKELKALTANVERLIVSGTLAQVGEAARIAPMIEAEQAKRTAAKPAKKAPAKKAAKAPVAKKGLQRKAKG